jgi:hypothetical protein
VARRGSRDPDLIPGALEFKISLVRPITPETGIIRAEGVVLCSTKRH